MAGSGVSTYTAPSTQVRVRQPRERPDSSSDVEMDLVSPPRLQRFPLAGPDTPGAPPSESRTVQSSATPSGLGHLAVQRAAAASGTDPMTNALVSLIDDDVEMSVTTTTKRTGSPRSSDRASKRVAFDTSIHSGRPTGDPGKRIRISEAHADAGWQRYLRPGNWNMTADQQSAFLDWARALPGPPKFIMRRPGSIALYTMEAPAFDRHLTNEEWVKAPSWKFTRTHNGGSWEARAMIDGYEGPESVDIWIVTPIDANNMGIAMS